MSDIFQSPIITTLPRLVPDYSSIEKKLEQFSKKKKVALVLPALFSEFETPAMKKIANTLKKITFVDYVIVSISRADAEQLEFAKKFFKDFAAKVIIIWHEQPEVVSLLDSLSDYNIKLGPQGKGRACWLGYGIALALNADVIAVHDCDIKTYSKELLVRMLYPVLNDEFNYKFCKGYYARFSDKLHARVTRLFFMPVLSSLLHVNPAIEFAHFLREFRYPLSGEFALTADLVKKFYVPGNWGIEVGVLSEVYNYCSSEQICQAELLECYDHKHQKAEANQKSRGLEGMVQDIMLSILEILDAKGQALTVEQEKEWVEKYEIVAQNYLKKYKMAALFNGLRYFSKDEKAAITIFKKSMAAAIDAHKEAGSKEIQKCMIPSWDFVIEKTPKFLEEFLNIVTK